MKYDRKKLIEQAKARIAELQGKGPNSPQKLEYEQKLKEYKGKLIDSYTLHLKSLKRWKPTVEPIPVLSIPNAPVNCALPSSYTTQKIQRLEGYIKQLEAVTEASIDVRSSNAMGYFFQDSEHVLHVEAQSDGTVVISSRLRKYDGRWIQGIEEFDMREVINLHRLGGKDG